MPLPLEIIARAIAMVRKGEGSAYDTGPAPVIRAIVDDDGEVTGHRIELDGEGLADFDDIHEALRAIEGLDWFKDGVARKNPDELAGDDGLAVGRWFDAARQEDLPAIQGGQITRDRIDEMVRNLTGLARAPVIDGGLEDSFPHQSIHLPQNTPATGFVLAGVRAVDGDGNWHLWLFGMLRPEVDESVNDRAIVYGSIAFLEDVVHPYTGEEVGARLLSYALTSEPYQDGLQPHHARADDQLISIANLTPNDDEATVHVRTTTPRRTQTMPRSRRTPSRRAHLRGEAADLLTAIAGLLGVDLSTMDDEALFELQDKIFALKSAAVAETIVEQAPPPEEIPAAVVVAPAPPAATPAAEEAARALRLISAQRALHALEGDALDAWATDILTTLRTIFAQPEATAEQGLELLLASMDAFTALVAAEGEELEEENTAEGGQPQDEAARTLRRARQRARVIGLQQVVDTQNVELTTLRALRRDQEIGDYIDDSYGAARITPPAGDRRRELVELCRSVPDFRSVIDLTLRAVNVPPMGPTVTHPTRRTPRGGEPASLEEAIERCANELRESGEELTKKQIRSRSYNDAKKRWPALVKRERTSGAN